MNYNNINISVTIKELVNEQKFNDMTDIQLIERFFILNNLELEGIDLINQLTKSKVEKMRHTQAIMKSWASYIPSKYLYETYDLDTADKLHMLELDYLSNDLELSKPRLEWAEKNIPNIKMPKIYFRPLIEWLDEKNIRFKGEKPIAKNERIYRGL